ncbi:MAG: WbqC family protein [Thermodesulfobacteriota bacterium]|nr:WbqC family protein [Thermodesulfobacteriota bacterium]
MKKRIAAIQSNYIPWKGYFDLINMADEFILYDDVQYTKKDWRNRNRIKTPNGLIWLTIPVKVKGRFHQKIRETAVSDYRWNRRHWNSIVCNYSRAKHFVAFRDVFEELYLDCNERLLSHINYRFLKTICRILGIDTRISFVMDYNLTEKGKTAKIIEMCKKAGAGEYIVGPAAKAYIEEDLFRQENIKLRYMDYNGYPKYNQLYPPFTHHVSIIDLILNEGSDASKYMLSLENRT